MAKKKVNKSEAIRQYLGKHPKASAQAVSKALKVKPALVYNVKSSMSKTRNGKVKRRVKRQSGSLDGMENVVAAANFIRECGGIEQARQALAAAAQVASALEG